MNSLLYLYAVTSCLIVVAAQQSKTAHLSKISDPPVKKTHPKYWSKGRGREFYLQSKNIWHIQIDRDGTVSGSKIQTEAAVILMISGRDRTVALMGKLAEKYLCMSNDSKVYATDSLHDTDCYFVEEYHNNSYNTYHHYYHRRGDKRNYLSIDNDGKIGVGNSTDELRIYFIPVDVNQGKAHSSRRPAVATATTTLSPVIVAKTTSTVPPIKRRLEKTRKRRRRWCKFLIQGKLEKNPTKYISRCKHDCIILKTMLDNPKRYKRKCEKQRKRRRRRNRKKHSRHSQHGRRHHHGQDNSKRRTRNNRGGERQKRTPVRSASSPQTQYEVT